MKPPNHGISPETLKILEEKLMEWFKETTIDHIFQTGSPSILPSKIQRQWETIIVDEYVELPEDIMLPKEIQRKVTIF
jgi:hypothetical protein